jgi:spore germination protein KC
MKQVSYGRFFQRVDAIVLLVSSLWGMLSLCLQLCLITKIFSKTFNVNSKPAVIIPLCFSLFFFSLNSAESVFPVLLYSAAVFVLMIIFCNKKSRILLLVLPIFLSGCYDRKEIDETAYIVALGIDKGEGAEYSYTFQFSAPLAISQEGEGGEKPAKQEDSDEGKNSTVRNLTINAPDFYIAKNMINNFMSKNIDMSHLKLIVFSAEVDENALENHSQLLLREREIRPHTAIAVAAESAADYLENVNPELEANTSKYYELMSLRSNNVYAPTKRLHDFVDELTVQGSDTALPVAVSGSKTSDFPADSSLPQWVSAHNSTISADRSVLYGMAIFKNGKLTSAMDGDSAMIYNILTQSIKSCTITVKNEYRPENTVSFRLIIPQKADYKININAKQIIVVQDLQAEFLGGALPEGYRSFDQLYSYANTVLTHRIAEYFTDLSKEKSADIMGLRNLLRKDFATWDKWDCFYWDNFYKNLNFDIKINFI